MPWLLVLWRSTHKALGRITLATFPRCAHFGDQAAPSEKAEGKPAASPAEALTELAVYRVLHLGLEVRDITGTAILILAVIPMRDHVP